ncbi:MAG: signal recognition particle-docking protein FtsY [Parvularculales bacterium]
MSSVKETSLLARLRKGLRHTTTGLGRALPDIVRKKHLDSETLEELEDILITTDMGARTAGRIVGTLADERHDKDITLDELRAHLAGTIAHALALAGKPLVVVESEHRPHVILLVGVNGGGKTTTAAKLSARLKKEGLSVLLVAADTFRAAASEQLQIWGHRIDVPVATTKPGGDAAALAFESFERARIEKIDVVLIDTAGRLHHREDLMAELTKIRRVIKRLDDDAPHDTLLVLDAITGQNAINQAEAFVSGAGVSGVIVTKLDGTARGGIVLALADKLSLPIHMIGVGEGVDDLQPFDAEMFAQVLVGL